MLLCPDAAGKGPVSAAQRKDAARAHGNAGRESCRFHPAIFRVAGYAGCHNINGVILGTSWRSNEMQTCLEDPFVRLFRRQHLWRNGSSGQAQG